MKSFKEVEQNRRDYHANAALNSVHRSSLLAPVMPGAALDISFLNHFLLKRGYKNVACRVTEIDAAGKRIQARLIAIDEPRAYTLRLSEAANPSATDFMIEFFCGDNLFIPFPAVMVNHRGDGFMNCVHAYNRVLNDVFEDDSINAVTQREAAIDVRLDERVTTFLLFTAGQTACRGDLRLSLRTDGRQLDTAVPLDVPRFGHRMVTLREAFPGLNRVSGGVLTVDQPKQHMFYGRILSGQITSDGAFSANHSYYDSSSAGEYWDDARPSARLYPFFADFDNRVRFYPILSPGRLKVEIGLQDRDGRTRRRVDAGTIATPSSGFIDVSINQACREAGIGLHEIVAFSVIVTPDGGKTPTRINHQLVFVSGGLESSINMSLTNPNVFTPPGKKGFCWGQLSLDGEAATWLGVSTNRPDGETCEIDVSFYGGAGKIAEKRVRLPGGSARAFRIDELLPADAMPGAGEPSDYVWYELRSDRPDVFGYSVTQNRRTGHCAGEHAF
jgi:hypothetical protein